MCVVIVDPKKRVFKCLKIGSVLSVSVCGAVS